ncbi:ubiquitin carboxyl-terminal hydrolase CYLD [Anguilla anguilla]|uniref:ubiquitin carboxyl-terminal hydrolase CYLD n=1 Tax=Anguilla anguilla TaxID=7936 RepID=UPI0015A88B76|nr:ubiquitin carboxyl-terminal hydrolase CYLD [Anguilla anguilla]
MPAVTLPTRSFEATARTVQQLQVEPRLVVVMERKEGRKDRFFIVTRGKARSSHKGASKGSIGWLEAETPRGELVCQLYGSSGSCKGAGVVKCEDTYPLSRHQAQLLLFVLPPHKRLELLCNPQLFAAICDLAQDDLVMVKHKRGLQPGLVKNLMKIGRRENPSDLLMLGFEVELLDTDQKSSPKKQAPLPLVSAGDIIQVLPNYTPKPQNFSTERERPRDGDRPSEGISTRAISRIHSLPNLRSRSRQVGGGPQKVGRVPALQSPLEVGSMVEVEVEAEGGVTVYGVMRWMGVPEEHTDDWAGLELDYEVSGCTDGTFRGQRYFTCEGNRALFVPLGACRPDGRFQSQPAVEVPPQYCDKPSDISVEEEAEDAPPIPESEALSLLEGRMKGIQGHYNSCYLDATLFSLFSSSMTLDNLCHCTADTGGELLHILRKRIINRLRRQGFVPAEGVMSFRKQLGCNSFMTEEKDPEEFITLLLQQVLHVEPLLKIRSGSKTTQDAYTFQIILEKEQMGPLPTVQQLLESSFLSCDLKFEEVPACLMVQMPRFGKGYKMFPQILPSTELDITDLLHNATRECFLCGRRAEVECVGCLRDRKLQPGRIKQYCITCSTQVHSHPLRQDHTPRKLAVPADLPVGDPTPRQVLELFAVLCINTSHYVSFVKFGPAPRSWLFFDSMADRCGDDQNGYSVPEVKACPEVGDFLSRPEEDLAIDHSNTGDLVKRLLQDSYMCLYQRLPAQRVVPNHQTSPAQITMPNHQTSPAQITIPNRQTSPAQITIPNRQTSPAQITIPNHQTSPAQITIPNHQTSPAQITIPNRLTSPAQITLPDHQMLPSQVAKPNCQITPAQITMPNHKASSAKVTLPNHQMAPSQVTMPNRRTSPAQITMSNHQTSPAQITVPNYQTLPAKMTLPDHQIAPSQMTIPNCQTSPAQITLQSV